MSAFDDVSAWTGCDLLDWREVTVAGGGSSGAIAAIIDETNLNDLDVERKRRHTIKVVLPTAGVEAILGRRLQSEDRITLDGVTHTVINVSRDVGMTTADAEEVRFTEMSATAENIRR